MSTAELKERIIAEINDSEDDNMLQDVMRLIKLDSHSSEIYTLNEEELLMVREGEIDIKNGNTISGEEANDEIQKWLGK